MLLNYPLAEPFYLRAEAKVSAFSMDSWKK